MDGHSPELDFEDSAMGVPDSAGQGGSPASSSTFLSHLPATSTRKGTSASFGAGKRGTSPILGFLAMYRSNSSRAGPLRGVMELIPCLPVSAHQLIPPLGVVLGGVLVQPE